MIKMKIISVYPEESSEKAICNYTKELIKNQKKVLFSINLV